MWIFALQVVSDPVGYGFVIRGSRPVYVHTIDPSGPATAAGLQVCVCVCLCVFVCVCVCLCVCVCVCVCEYHHILCPQVGEYLYSVNGQNVLHASHTEAARIILMGSSTASLVTFIERHRLDS